MMNEHDIGNKDWHFKGQHSNEELECFYRHHWIVLLAPTLMYFIFLGALSFFLYFMKNTTFLRPDEIIYQSILLFAFVFSVYYIHRFFVEIFNYFLKIVIITNYRVIDLHKTLILHDTKEVIDIAKIQDVTKMQDGLIRNILGYGKLIITLSSASSIKVLHFVPNPDFHFRVINRKKREYVQHKQFERRRESGLHIDLSSTGLSSGTENLTDQKN